MSRSRSDKKNRTHKADMTAIPKSIPYSNKEFIISFMLFPSIFQSCSTNPGVPHPSAATKPRTGVRFSRRAFDSFFRITAETSQWGDSSIRQARKAYSDEKNDNVRQEFSAVKRFGKSFCSDYNFVRNLHDLS